MAQRLWDKGEGVNSVIFDFTVGNDPINDTHLLPWDCAGSAAHAKMLAKVGLLSERESKEIVGELKSLYQKSLQGELQIPRELEDCHTFLESELTKQLGEAGERVHTGRSRNDQVMLCLRLYMRDALLKMASQISAILHSLDACNLTSGKLPLPGYTHLMPAMPSSVGMWLHAQYEAFFALLQSALMLIDTVNSSPLGAASGFDVPLPLNRSDVAQQLGFDRVQRSVIDVQNSRGRHERAVLFLCSEIGTAAEKIAWDLQLFFMKEFGFVKLPNALTTGSSIMPQKRNPDVLELMRATGSKIRAALHEVQGVSAKLPSNYHRDFQLTKEPFFRGVQATEQLLQILPIVIENLAFDEAKLLAAMHPELYATYGVYSRVRSGAPFRQAYREVAKNIGAGKDEFTPYTGDFSIIEQRDQESWQAARAEHVTAQADLAARKERIASALEKLFR